MEIISNDKIRPSITLTHGGSYNSEQDKYCNLLEKHSELNGVMK